MMMIQQISSLGSLGIETGEHIFLSKGRKPEGSFRAPTYKGADLIIHHNGRAGLDFIGFWAKSKDSEDLSEGDIKPRGVSYIKPCFIPIKFS